MSGRDLVYAYGSLISAFVALKLIHILFIAGGVCRTEISLEGKTAIVTGANTGEGGWMVAMTGKQSYYFFIL